jgi:hypothetical protein
MSEDRRPSLPMTGGCQCGAVRYRISEWPLTLYACHCTECQTQSSAGFGMSMPVPRAGLSVEGAERIVGWPRRSASGRTVLCRFCAVCGTRLFHESERNPAIVNVKPGTLDDTGWIHPVGHLWTGSAQAWFRPPDGTLEYGGQPPDFDALFDAWRAWLEAGA